MPSTCIGCLSRRPRMLFLAHKPDAVVLPAVYDRLLLTSGTSG